jgi:hypothetical protein
MDFGTIAVNGFGMIIIRNNVFRDISPYFRANVFLSDNNCGQNTNNTVAFDNNIVSTSYYPTGLLVNV